MSYDVEWSPTAQRAVRRLPEKVATAAIEFVYGSRAADPHRVGKALRFELEGLHSARRGDYGTIYRIGESKVTILAVDHRADAYRR